MCVACTSEALPDDGSQGDGPPAKVINLDGGGRVIVPTNAFPAGTEIEISHEGAPPTPGTRSGLTEPVDVSADGEQPSVPITLEFPYDPASVPDGVDPSEVMGVSTFDEAAQEWTPLEVRFDEERHVMVAISPTLSWKWPWEWDWPAIGAGINQRAGELGGKRAAAAACRRGTSPPGWVQSVGTSNDDAIALRTCAESENGALVIEMVNNRPYGVVMDIDAPTRWMWRAEPDDPAQLLAAVMLDEVLPDDQLYLPPLGHATIAVKKGSWSSAQLRTEANAATIIATYLTLAFGDLLTKRAAIAVGGELAGSCVAKFIKTNADAIVRSLTDVRVLVDASMDCVTQVLEGRVLDRALTPSQRGRAAGAYKALGRVSWWLKAFSTEWDTVDMLFDKLSVGPITVPVHVRAPMLKADGGGLGEWQFGDPAAPVLAGMTEWFGPPDYDPGWDEFEQGASDGRWYGDGQDPLSPAWEHPFFRVACWQSLCSLFGGPSEADATFRGWELSRWQAWNGYADVDASEPRIALAGSGIQIGDTWSDFTDAYPQAAPGGGEGNSLVIDNPPWPGIFDGVWAWRLDGVWDPAQPMQAPADSEITRMSGGTGPEPGCC
jgi:hypothetical protein